MRGLFLIALALATSGVSLVAEAATEPPASPGRTTPRRLEDIHIEGEVPVPQVLFITGRDQRRFLEFRHREYLQSSVEVGRAAVMPSHFHLVGIPPNLVRKEIAP